MLYRAFGVDETHYNLNLEEANVEGDIRTTGIQCAFLLDGNQALIRALQNFCYPVASALRRATLLWIGGYRHIDVQVVGLPDQMQACGWELMNPDAILARQVWRKPFPFPFDVLEMGIV